MCVKRAMVSLRNYDDKVTDNTDNWVKMELSIVINAHYQQLNKQHPSTFLHCGGADPLYRTLQHHCRINRTAQTVYKCTVQCTYIRLFWTPLYHLIKHCVTLSVIGI